MIRQVAALSCLALMAVPAAEARRPVKLDREKEISCPRAIAILAAASSMESAASDAISRRAPAFPTTAVQSPTGQIGSSRLSPDSEFWKFNWQGVKPSRALVRRWFAAPYRSISTCAGDLKRVDSLPGWKRDGTGSRATTRYEVQATLPVLDASARRALLIYSTTAMNGTPDGHTHMLLLARSAKGWGVIGTGFLSVS